jgi:hypothetical protein
MIRHLGMDAFRLPSPFRPAGGRGEQEPIVIYSLFERIFCLGMLFECRFLWLFAVIDIAARPEIHYRDGEV